MSKLDKVCEWVEKLQAQQTEQELKQKEIADLKVQIAAMSNSENTRPCPSTGVNMFGNLDIIQEGGMVDLLTKAQAAMVAVQTTKWQWDD